VNMHVDYPTFSPHRLLIRSVLLNARVQLYGYIPLFYVGANGRDPGHDNWK